MVESVHSSNKVTVNPIEHDITQQSDYDWHTPNTAMDGKPLQPIVYNGGQHTEYVKQKPFRKFCYVEQYINRYITAI